MHTHTHAHTHFIYFAVELIESLHNLIKHTPAKTYENMDVSFPYPGSGVDMSSDNNIPDPVLSDSEFSSLTSSDEEESNSSYCACVVFFVYLCYIKYSINRIMLI